MKETNDSNNGMSFAGTLCLIFIVLRLTGGIDWSWVWVLSPIWISLAIVLAYAVAECFADKKR